MLYHMSFRIVFSISVKKSTGIFIEIAMNLYIALGSIDILTTLILLIHEHRISFYLFVFSIFFYQNLIVFSVQIFHNIG